jgi:hypothetical protein
MGVALPGPAEQLCRRCGRALPAERRFCVCGADLVRRPVDETTRLGRTPSWWAEWAAHRRFRTTQRTAGGAPYDAPASARTRLVRLVTILLVLLALASQLGPWGTALRREVSVRVDRVVGAPPAAGPTEP